MFPAFYSSLFFASIYFLLNVSFNSHFGASAEQWLDDFVSYYEIHQQNPTAQRQKRSPSAGGDDGGTFFHEVKAFNRSFILKLHSDTSSFSGDHFIEDGDGNVLSVDLRRFLVAGKVLGEDERTSDVHGSLVDGRFEGDITVGGVTYVVENAEKFDKHRHLKGDELLSYYSVVYRVTDVKSEPSSSAKRRRRSADGGASTCGWSHEDVRSSLLEHQHSSASRGYDEHLFRDDEGNKKRKRREAPSSEPVLLVADPLSIPKVCGVFMQVDHLLYKRFLQDTNSDFSAVANIMSYLNYVTNTVNKIYQETNFTTVDGVTAGPYKNVQMAVVRTKIYTTESAFARSFLVRPAEQITNLDPTNFLNLVSRQNYDLYCASFIFTLRDFSNGVLGLAWIHYPDMIQRGGVCDRYGPTRYGMQSLNAGIVTQLNYGEFVSRQVSATTFAHELGHSFGAQHDNTPSDSQIADPRCYPGGAEGNYIMYSSANSGDKPNNQRFSFCSRDAIAKNLKQIVTNPSALNCFKTSVQFCGNGIVDPGEECDCGFSDDCQLDANCCGPADDPNPAYRCRLKKTVGTKPVQCSLSNGACCDVRTCSYRSNSTRYVCRQASDCVQNAFCDGTSAVCPKGTPEDDGKLCGDLTKSCFAGECASSSCEMIRDAETKATYKGCQPERSSSDPNNFNRSELCFMSCRAPSSGKCFNSADVGSRNFDGGFAKFLVEFNQGKPIQMMAGAPCDNDRGYCDVFRKCRSVNTDGPLARLRDALFSESSLATLKSWIEEHWWAVMLIGIGVIAFMIIFVKLCSVHTPSDNRNFRAARPLVQRFQRTSFRPVLGHSGPPHGRGHGHQRPIHSSRQDLAGNGGAVSDSPSPEPIPTVSETISNSTPNVAVVGTTGSSNGSAAKNKQKSPKKSTKKQRPPPAPESNQPPPLSPSAPPHPLSPEMVEATMIPPNETAETVAL